MSSDIDVIVVGAGTSGCIIARRFLNAGARVLLIEAGQDVDPQHLPADMSDIYPRSYYNPAYAWPGLVAHQQVVSDAPSPFIQARVLGGGSSLMGMVALRGLSADYDEWAQRLPDWSSDQVNRTFTQLEDDDARSGTGPPGPVSIRRLDRSSWPPFIAAVGDAAARAGFTHIPDLNADDGDGFGPLPLSRTSTRRVSSATAFLPATARANDRLRIVPDSEVRRLLFSGSRCVGVAAVTAGRAVTYSADHVVLCAGAVFTPLLLQRSGIGDPDLLRGLGIDVVAPLRAVGENLQNHPVAGVAAHLPRSARQPASIRQGFIAALRVSSGIDAGVGDLLVIPLNKSSWHGLGVATAGMGVTLMAPRSRGSVRLVAGQGGYRPSVSFNFLSDPVDRQRMQHGFDLAIDLLRDPEVRKNRHEVFPASYTKTVRTLNAPGLRNAVLTRAIAALLSGPGIGRRAMLRIGMSTGSLSEQRLAQQQWRQDTLLGGTFGTYHVAGTCAMGPPDDDTSVVDHRGDVIGINGLTVADASIMPTIPRANTNLPVQMVAMRIADLQLHEAQRFPEQPGAAPHPR
ncbi:GMC family oxidoreductase [Streptomyces sp. NBC_00028]|uniref:GMC family oxidoreductase n=1 Tax=Streptomyces sp. NBC_00028 TaxID=2975624 RepID=UPI00324839F8